MKLKYNQVLSSFTSNTMSTRAPYALGVVNPAVAETIRRIQAEEGGALTYFEVLTALAFMRFKKCAVDAAVVEVGVGGRGFHSTTFQLNLGRFGHLPGSPCLTDWGNIMHPRYPTTCAYFEPKSGRV